MLEDRHISKSSERCILTTRKICARIRERSEMGAESIRGYCQALRLLKEKLPTHGGGVRFSDNSEWEVAISEMLDLCELPLTIEKTSDLATYRDDFPDICGLVSSFLCHSTSSLRKSGLKATFEILFRLQHTRSLIRPEHILQGRVVEFVCNALNSSMRLFWSDDEVDALLEMMLWLSEMKCCLPSLLESGAAECVVTLVPLDERCLSSSRLIPVFSILSSLLNTGEIAATRLCTGEVVSLILTVFVLQLHTGTNPAAKERRAECLVLAQKMMPIPIDQMDLFLSTGFVPVLVLLVSYGESGDTGGVSFAALGGRPMAAESANFDLKLMALTILNGLSACPAIKAYICRSRAASVALDYMSPVGELQEHLQGLGITYLPEQIWKLKAGYTRLIVSLFPFCMEVFVLKLGPTLLTRQLQDCLSMDLLHSEAVGLHSLSLIVSCLGTAECLELIDLEHYVNVLSRLLRQQDTRAPVSWKLLALNALVELCSMEEIVSQDFFTDALVTLMTESVAQHQRHPKMALMAVAGLRHLLRFSETARELWKRHDGVDAFLNFFHASEMATRLILLSFLADMCTFGGIYVARTLQWRGGPKYQASLVQMLLQMWPEEEDPILPRCPTISISANPTPRGTTLSLDHTLDPSLRESLALGPAQSPEWLARRLGAIVNALCEDILAKQGGMMGRRLLSKANVTLLRQKIKAYQQLKEECEVENAPLVEEDLLTVTTMLNSLEKEIQVATATLQSQEEEVQAKEKAAESAAYRHVISLVHQRDKKTADFQKFLDKTTKKHPEMPKRVTIKEHLAEQRKLQEAQAAQEAVEREGERERERERLPTRGSRSRASGRSVILDFESEEDEYARPVPHNLPPDVEDVRLLPSPALVPVGRGKKGASNPGEPSTADADADAMVEGAAAIKIQSAFRGYAQRKEAHHTKIGKKTENARYHAPVQPSPYRFARSPLPDRRDGASDEEAALRIQSIFRGYSVRRHLETLKAD